jgi:hypothetical protein
MVSILVVNPESIRPAWPITLSYAGQTSPDSYGDSEAFGWDVEVLDTDADDGVVVTDASGQRVHAVVLEPGWTPLLHVAVGSRTIMSYTMSDSSLLLVERVGDNCTRSVMLGPTRQVRGSYPTDCDQESRLEVPGVGAPVEDAGFAEIWFTGVWAAKSRSRRQEPNAPARPGRRTEKTCE